MSKQDNNDISWVPTLVGRLLTAPIIEETHGPMTCPICDCDHQVFQGTGVLGLDKDGTHIVCAFPSTETICKIDLPPEIKLGGLTTYTRYVCGCGGHQWAFIQAFLKDSTQSWCCDLTPHKPKKMCGKKGQPKAINPPMSSPSLMQTLQNMVQGMLAGGHTPALMLGNGIISQLTPQEIASLKAQGVIINPTGPISPIKPGPPANSATEHPTTRMPATVRYAWQNWKESKPVDDDQTFNFQLPKIPVKSTNLTDPPYLAVGTTDSKLFNSLQEWVFSLAVEIAPEVRRTIHAFVYWENILLVITNAPANQRQGIAEGVAAGVMGLKKFKPDLYMLTKKDYSVLVKSKADEANKAK